MMNKTGDPDNNFDTSCRNSIKNVSAVLTWRWPIICLLFVLYACPIVYVILHRNKAETKARSPLTTIICLGLLFLDSALNTVIFSVDSKDGDIKKVRFKCLLGVWVTMAIMVPILLTILIRAYRVLRVFELYEAYLGAIFTNRGN